MRQSSSAITCRLCSFVHNETEPLHDQVHLTAHLLEDRHVPEERHGLCAKKVLSKSFTPEMDCRFPSGTAWQLRLEIPQPRQAANRCLGVENLQWQRAMQASIARRTLYSQPGDRNAAWTWTNPLRQGQQGEGDHSMDVYTKRTLSMYN